MSYLVLARKFRPQDFSSIAGQEHVTKTLGNAIAREQVSHAFLFCGPRGVGKTSVARVLAKALNCEEGPTANPCLKCTNCVEITEGRSLAVREIDGASHNSVDNVRDLIETLRSQPPPGSKYKVYIIDEVHMLSIAAFNALLKNLEEPPPNTIFVLATTEPHKIPDTVISRCQRYDFRAMTTDVIEARLREISRAEAIDAEPEVFRMIARLARGSMRDAQSLLDRVRSFSDTTLTAQDASLALGVAERGLLIELSKAVFDHDSDLVLQLLERAFSTGLDPRLFLDEFVSHWRDLLLAKFGGEKSLKRNGVPEDVQTELLRQVESAGAQDLQDLVHLAREGADEAMRSSYPKHSLEALTVRMATRAPVHELGELISLLKKNGTKVALDENSAAKQKTPNVRPVAKVATVPKAKVPATVEKQAVQTTSSSSWREFVHLVTQKEKGAFGEFLKRLSVIDFENGKLSATGAKLVFNYFQDRENKEKLVELLNTYKTNATWIVHIDLVNENAGTSVKSLHEEERDDRKHQEQKRFQNATSNEAVENIKKFFPGSVLEKH